MTPAAANAGGDSGPAAGTASVVARLRAHTRGVLQTPEGVTRAGVFKIGYVIASRPTADGRPRLIVPMPAGQREWGEWGERGGPDTSDRRGPDRAERSTSPATSTPVDASFMVPDEHEASVHLHVALAPLTDQQAGADGDRWRGYHGAAHPSGAWLEAAVVAARVPGPGPSTTVVAGEELDLSNPLGPVAGAMLRLANADRATLARATSRATGRAVELADEPVAVGVDPRGLHVRVRGGVLRVALSLDPSLDFARDQGESGPQRALRAWLLGEG